MRGDAHTASRAPSRSSSTVELAQISTLILNYSGLQTAKRVTDEFALEGPLRDVTGGTVQEN